MAAPPLPVPLGRLFGLLFLARGLLLLALHLPLLLARRLVELALGADQIAPRVPDGKDKRGDHHGEDVERVDVFLVKGDRVVGGVDAAGELDQAEDDSDLCAALETAEQKESNKNLQ